VDFRRVLETLLAFGERERIRFAVVGAFGLAAYGRARATVDLDVATEAGVQPRLVAFLESLGYETLHVSEGYSNHLHRDPLLGRVDLIYVGATPPNGSSMAAAPSYTSGSAPSPCRGPSTSLP
jgi:hypothetical protein